MGALLLFVLILALIGVLITVHEAGHYAAGWVGGVPARDMRLVLLAFPQHVALRDGSAWVSPVRDIGRYVAVCRRHLHSRAAAFGYVAGGMALEMVFSAAAWGAALALGYQVVAFWVGGVSLSMYAINVGLMDLPWAVRYRRAVGDTSGLWQIAPAPAVVFSAAMLAGRVLLVVAAA